MYYFFLTVQCDKFGMSKIVKITNDKHQNTNNSQYPNYNIQSCFGYLTIDIWNLFAICYLVLVI